MARIGVALSGGGHRATVWALGALLFLTDAEQQHRVNTIASVSGGSIANGVLARKVDYSNADGNELRSSIAPTLAHIAYEGLFFFGPATNPYVYGVLALASLTTLLLLAVLVLGVLASGWVVVAAMSLFVLALGVTVAMFSQRSLVAERGLAKVHFGEATLAEMTRPVQHIFCATELQAGNHAFFAPDFVYGYRHGIGSPGDLRLATAVQCSACLPGAFVPRRLPADRHHFRPVVGVTEPTQTPAYLVLNDGGVYDNMGDEWFAGYRARARTWPELSELCPLPDELIIVNSSGGWGWAPIQRWSPLRRELVGVLGSKDVLYNSSTRIRRRDLIDMFSANEQSGQGPTGALVHIPQSPFTTADGFKHGTDARGDRARAVLAALGDDPVTRQRWDDIAKRDTHVKTVLRKLGEVDTARLLHHAYVLAMCNLHVILGYPLLALPDEGDFLALFNGQAKPG